MNRSRKRVVVTGIGAMSPLGTTTEALWEGLKAGKSGLDYMTLVDMTKLPCKVAGEVPNFVPTERIERRDSRRMGRFSQLAVAATFEAMVSAQLNASQEDRYRIGCIIGSGAGGLPETESQVKVKLSKGVNRISPMYIPIMLVNMASANVSRTFGAAGYTNTCSTACAAGTQAIGEAVEVIRRGTADVMITGGSEAGICEVGLGGFASMGAITRWAGEPAQASRPFDAQRDGFAPAEGAGVLILESLEHAEDRGKEPLAEIIGWSATSDAFHLVQPDSEGKGAAQAMRIALQDAAITPAEVDYINAHGTSTPMNDAIETMAMKKVFGGCVTEVAISSTKSMLGHSLGASGALEAVTSVLTIRDNVVHPTINQQFPDPQCDLDYVANKAREKDVRVVLSNSFGFGGQNACLVIRNFIP